MKELATFTALSGYQYFGVVLAVGKTGMLEVFWDESHQLLANLDEHKGGRRAADERYHRARIGWIRTTEEDGPGSRLSSLAGQQVAWTTAEHKALHEAAQDGRFDDAVEEMREVIYDKYY